MTTNKFQASFTSGELSPALATCVDISQYTSGLKTCENMIIDPKGGVFNRPGTLVNLESENNSGKPVRLINFNYGDGDNIDVEFGYDYIRFWRDNALIGQKIEDYALYSHNNDYIPNDQCYVGNHIRHPFIYLEDGTTSYINWLYMYTSDTTIDLNGHYIATINNSTDDLSVTRYVASPTETVIRIKYANRSLFKNAPSYINAAIHALGTVGGINYANVHVVLDRGVNKYTESNLDAVEYRKLNYSLYEYAALTSSVTALSSGQVLSGAHPIYSTNYITSGTDFVEDYSIEPLFPYKLRVITTAKITGIPGYLKFTVERSTTSNFAVIVSSSTYDLYLAGDNINGDIFDIVVPPIEDTGAIYIRMKYWGGGGSFTAGTVKCFLTRFSMCSTNSNYTLKNAYGSFERVANTASPDYDYGYFPLGYSFIYSVGGVVSNTQRVRKAVNNIIDYCPFLRRLGGSDGSWLVLPYDGTYSETVEAVPAYQLVDQFDQPIDFLGFKLTDIRKIKYTQSADYLFLCDGESPVKELVRLANDNWILKLYEPSIPPFQLSNINESFHVNLSAVDCKEILTNTANRLYGLGSSNYDNNFIKIKHPVSAGFASGAFAYPIIVKDGDLSATISSGGDWNLWTSGTFDAELEVQGSYDYGATWSVLKKISSRTIEFYQNASTTNGNVNITRDTNSSDKYNFYNDEQEQLLIRLRVSISSGTLDYELSCNPYTHEGIYKLGEYDASTGGHPCKVVKYAYSTAQTTDWAIGAWSEYYGFPSQVCFHNDRLCFAGSPSDPQTIWMTKIGDYWNFGRSKVLQDTDGVTITLNSRKINAIRNLVSLGELLAFTSSSEWKISAGDGGVITPTSFNISEHSFRGSDINQIEIIGNRAIFVQASGKILRDFAFDANTASFTGDDLTILSDHLFDGYTIKDMEYQQSPYSILWVVRSDGMLLSLSYLKEQGVLAWAKHDVGGDIESITSSISNGLTTIKMVVKRGSMRYIERFATRVETTAEDSYFLDSGVTYSGTAITTLSGLDHLEGETVTAVCNGFVVENLLVTSGDITLPIASTKVHAGLPFISTIETLNVDSVSTNDKQKKISQVMFYLMNTIGGYIGANSTDLIEMIQSTPAILGTPIQPFTGKFVETLNSGYDKSTSVIVKQTKPYPMRILNINPLITLGGN